MTAPADRERSPWRPGDTVVLRHARDHYRWAVPMHVVEDRGDFVALYLQPGSEFVRMGDEAGKVTRDFTQATRVVRTTWTQHHALHLMRAGDGHAVVLFWSEHGWNFRCWYINFQDPFVRTARGFGTMDLTLDLVIAPDLKTWMWKDEDEFARGIEFGWYTSAQLAALTAYGEDVVRQATAAAPPFGEPWPAWRPDPFWQPLRLPPDWDN